MKKATAQTKPEARYRATRSSAAVSRRQRVACGYITPEALVPVLLGRRRDVSRRRRPRGANSQAGLRRRSPFFPVRSEAEPGFVGEDRGLDTVVHAELVEDRATDGHVYAFGQPIAVDGPDYFTAGAGGVVSTA